MKYLLVTFTLTLLISFSYGQEENFNPEIKKYFLITASTRDYLSAVKKANSIAAELELKLDLRGLIEHNADLGLTWQKSNCEEDGWEFPCYIARGRWDDGNYVSVEWSSAYQGFSKGYFVVMIASHSKYDDDLINLLEKAKKFVPSAYIKSSMIYIGCMH